MKLITLLTIITLFSACGEQENSSASQSQAESPSLFETQLDALERAEEVEGMLEDAVKKREEEMQKRGI